MSQFSAPSTMPSTPTNDSIEKVIKNDSIRYSRKGYGLITATFIAVTFFFVLPRLFYPIWAWFTKNYNPGDLTIFLSTWLGHTVCIGISNLVMWMVYRAKSPFFERYKIESTPWPWEVDYDLWITMVKKTMKALAITHGILSPSMMFLDVYVLKSTPIRLDLESYPGPGEIIPQMIFFMLCEDFFFYWGHRTLHSPYLYQLIHKQHHEYNTPVSIAAEYAHPIESVVANMIPFSMGMHLLGTKVHYVTWMMWLIVRTFETTDGHCGYEFSWSPFRLLPLSGSAKYHDFHHSHNLGNYGSFFTLWDTLMSTNTYYFKFLAKEEQKEANVRKREEIRALQQKQQIKGQESPDSTTTAKSTKVE